MNEERLNTFVDAIIAIILTIMVLEFKTPSEPTLKALSKLLHPFLAYLNTFIIIWVTWYSNHELMKGVTKVTYKLYWLIAVFIFLLSLQPFATAWVGQNINALIPNLFYMLISLLSFINYHLLLEPEALKNTPQKLRPQIRYSVPLETIRIIAIIIDITVIWFWPPISLVIMLLFSGLHITEHLHLWKINKSNSSNETSN